jgi:hypothetical protein
METRIQQRRGYRPLGQSNFASVRWWVALAGELIGAVTGWVVGFLVLIALTALDANDGLGWIPWAGSMIGGLTVRGLILRQPRR